MAVHATSLLLCHLVFEDPTSNNVTVLGVFTQLRANRFPTPARDYSVYVLLTGAPHEADELLLQCSEVATGQMCAEVRSRTQLSGFGKRHVHIRVGELQFPNAGEYRWALFFGGDRIAEADNKRPRSL